MSAWKMLFSVMLIVFISYSSKLPTQSGPQFSATVNYDLSLDEMIAAGKYDYDYVSVDFTTKGFLAGKKGQTGVNFTLVQLIDTVATDTDTVVADTVLKRLNDLGLRAATLPELLAFGAKYPDEQRKYPIAALGSVVMSNGYRVVAVLCESGSKRGLDLGVYAGWYRACRFLAVRK